MYDLTFALKTLMAALSFAGYSFFLTRRWHIHPLIAPAVVIPALGTVMVISGILNIMLLMVYLLCGLGLALLVYTLIVNKGTKGLLHPAHLVVLAAFFWLLWRLQGAQVHSVDNFHHWLRVLKVLLANDELPSYRTPMITFQAYPTGSASYLYYMLRLIGYREDLAIIAQLMMLVVFCLPLFALPKKGKWLAWVALAGFLAVALSQLYERDTLLVDDLQAFIGISAIAIAYYYRADLFKALLCLTPTAIFTVFIKNSAFYFIAMTTLFLMVVLQDKQQRGRLKIVFLNFILPSLVFYLWTRHVAQVFNSGLGYGMEAKHALNLSSYYDQAKSWGISRIPELLGRVFEQAFGTMYFPGLLALLSTLAALLLTVPLWISGKTREAIRSLLLLGFALLGYVLWEAGIVGMFAVSMPYGETDMLACAERYMMTGLVYMFGLMVLSAVESVNSWPDMSKAAPRAAAVALALACAYVPVHFSGFPGQWGAPLRHIAARNYFAQLQEKHTFPFGVNIIYVTDQGNQYYQLNKYMMTDFLAESAFPMSTADAETLADVAQAAAEYAADYDILLIDTQNDEVLDGLADAMDKGAFYHMRVFLDLDEVLQ